MGEYLRKKNGHWVIATNHFAERLRQRCVGMDRKQFDALLDCILDYYAGNKGKFSAMPYNTEFFCFSQQHNRGVVLAHRRDTRTGTDNMHLVLLTVYPKGVKFPSHTETPRMVIN